MIELRVRGGHVGLLFFRDMRVLPAGVIMRYLRGRTIPFVPAVIAQFDVNWRDSGAQGHTTLSCVAGGLLLSSFLRLFSESLPSGLVPIFTIDVGIGIVVSLVIRRLVA